MERTNNSQNAPPGRRKNCSLGLTFDSLLTKGIKIFGELIRDTVSRIKLHMRLADLLYCIDKDVTVWVSEGVYFETAGSIPLRIAVAYDVVKIYPEHYRAIYDFAGISVIVARK